MGPTPSLSPSNHGENGIRMPLTATSPMPLFITDNGTNMKESAWPSKGPVKVDTDRERHRANSATGKESIEMGFLGGQKRDH